MGMMRVLNQNNLEKIEQILQTSNDPVEIISNIVELRRMLQNEITDINEIDLSIVKNLINYMGNRQYPRLQAEVTSILSNISSGNNYNCDSIINQGGVEKMLLEIQHNSEINFRINILWTLANLSADKASTRDFIVKQGAIKILSQLSNNFDPTPKYSNVSAIVPYINNMLNTIFHHSNNNNNQDNIKNMNNFNNFDFDYHLQQNMKLLKQISQFQFSNLRDQKDFVLTGIIDTIYQYFITEKFSQYQIDIIIIIGNLLFDFEREYFLKIVSLFIDQICPLMIQGKTNRIRANAIWVMNNIALNKQQNIIEYFKQQNFQQFLPLLQNFESESSPNVQKEIIILTNTIIKQSCAQIFEILLKNQLIEVLAEGLKIDNQECILYATKCVKAMLQKCLQNKKINLYQRQNNYLIKKIEDQGIDTILYDLQQNPSDEIYQTSQFIIENYLYDENDVQSENSEDEEFDLNDQNGNKTNNYLQKAGSKMQEEDEEH
ncbi:Armadillo-type fold [Pseudocohnilembus persalinus]|uniref:Armadillo-type fold n=1 Tax=Pseudocohnilembus persalinus TaxID=266149 RepID=A0A0V0QP17_PSEPJ|nr:Armadillo-type fold [Pseudocohnilembus persalinus]|eukprot:KRX04030.1 Armadillo-type fold [Pseudocohnilembus persalinus]